MFTAVLWFFFFSPLVEKFIIQTQQYKCARSGVIAMSTTEGPKIVVGIDFGTTLSGYIYLRNRC